MDKVKVGSSKMIKIGSKRKDQDLGDHIVRFRIISNRGHPSMVGLTSLELFDGNGEAIRIKKENIKQPANSQRVLNLFDGCNYTVDETHMWVAVLSDKTIDIEVCF